MKKNQRTGILLAGLAIGVIASLLVLLGNPSNMGFCIACFLRDTAGALGLHSAAAVQYVRPELIGLVLGSFVLSCLTKEFKPRGGSSPMLRLILGFFVMIGALMFLGCPFRMILRLAGGDLNALTGIAGFALGILTGVLFLHRGYSLKRTYKLSMMEGLAMPLIQIALLAVLLAAPGILHFTEAGGGPGGKHAAIYVSLAAGLLVGALSQRSRLCMAGGIRDAVLFRDTRLLSGFGAVLMGALVTNLIISLATGTGYIHFSFSEQPIAHTDGLWNALGMYLVGFGSILLGGCPLRQLILAGEGNSDSAVTVVGMVLGAACAHNFGLASSAAGPTENGKIAVVLGIIVTAVIGLCNTVNRKGAAK